MPPRPPPAAGGGGKGGTAVTSGIDLIVDERRRQVESEGWTPEHDDGHADGSLVEAAYLIVEKLTTTPLSGASWPHELSEHVARKYADDPIRRLTIAGALIAAEIDRLQRKAPAHEA